MKNTFCIIVLVGTMTALLSGMAGSFPAYLNTWSDLDTRVAEDYDGLTNSACCIYPPGGYAFGFSAGYCVFGPDSDLAAATNLFVSSPRMGIPVWTVRAVETQAEERVWLYAGADGNFFRIHPVPSDFNPRAWVRGAYGDPPAWLSTADLDEWYADRDRSRMRLELSLVASNDWPLLLEAWHAAATNAPASGTSPPTLPPDTNQLALAGIECAVSNAPRLWVYTPTNPVPVDLFTCATLTNGLWALLGTMEADSAFTVWDAAAAGETAFFRAARGDVDSDGDGISDGREMLLFGTNPLETDSDFDGLSDLEETCRYMTGPNWVDSDADGIWDGWEVAYGLNPTDISDGGGDADGDGLTNLEEFGFGTDPRDKDTDGDGVPDGEDETPTAPGPGITIDSPQEGETLTNAVITVSGTVGAASGNLDSVWVCGVSAGVYGLTNAVCAFTNHLTLEEGQREIPVTVMGSGSSVPQSRKVVAVTADALPPDVTILSPTNGQSFAGSSVRVTAWTDSSNDTVTVNGAAATRDGYIRYAWVRLPSVGTNIAIQAVAVDVRGRIRTNAVTVVCTDDTYVEPDDSDNDGVANGSDPAPNDPAVKGAVVVTHPPNGIILYAN